MIPVYQDVEERQGGSGGDQTCQGSGGREGHVLGKITSTEEFVCVWRDLYMRLFK